MSIEYAIDELNKVDERNIPKAHGDRVRLVAKHLLDFVMDNKRENPEKQKLSFSLFVRKIRLKYGFGEIAIRRILRTDYKLTVEDDRLVEAL